MKHNENHPLAWSKSADFLGNYSWEGKTKEQIIKEMALPDYEQKYVEDGMKELASQAKFTEFDLDHYILMRLDMEEEEDDFDEDDVLYKNQMAIRLNGKQFILDETDVAELFFLMDQERIKLFLGLLGQNLQDFMKEFQRASAEIDKR